MHTSTSRTEQAERTRRRILDAAAELASAQGDESVRILEVAAAAGVSTGALYHHFVNRSDLMAALHVERYRGSLPADIAFIDRLVDLSTDVHAFKAGILELTRTVNRPERSVTRRWRAATIGLSLHQPDVAAAIALEQQHANQTMAAAFERAQERGWIDATADPRAIAMMFQAIALGLVLADVDPDGAPDPAAWEALVSRVLDSVLIDP
jgi:AcrR family transcriptional regulator